METAYIEVRIGFLHCLFIYQVIRHCRSKYIVDKYGKERNGNQAEKYYFPVFFFRHINIK